MVRALLWGRTWWLVWWALLIAGVAQAALAMRVDRFPLDVRLTREWQDIDPTPLEPLLSALNALDAEARAAIGLAVVVWGLVSRRHRFAAWFVVAPLAAQALNGLLKVIVDRPRPSNALVRVTERADGSGFPSGHVMNSVIVFGFLFAVADDLVPSRPLRLVVRAACVIIIAFMGLARIDAGAHWPSDAVGGYVFGALVLLPIVWVYRTLRPTDDAPPPS